MIDENEVFRLWHETSFDIAIRPPSILRFARALESRVLAERKQDPIYEVRDDDNHCRWYEVSKEAYDRRPFHVRRIVFTHPTQDDAPQSQGEKAMEVPMDPRLNPHGLIAAPLDQGEKAASEDASR